MVALAKSRARMSVEEFLNWESGDFLNYELVDGEPRVMAPASRTHGTLQHELGWRITTHLRQRGSPYDVVITPGVIPRLLPDHNMRVPDLGVTCSPYTAEQSALPEPVLLVEILSPSNQAPGNQAKTWTNVWAYTSIPSVDSGAAKRPDRR